MHTAKQFWFKNNLKKSEGFTLAEVIVTLAVIGVIAALTIPSLIQNIQDQQYKSAWKSTFSTIAQATRSLNEDKGGTLLGVFTDWAPMKNAYLPYLNYVKQCTQFNNLGNCWHNYGNFKYLNGTSISNNWNSNNGIILSNGAFIQPVFTNNSSTCTNIATYPAGDCGYIVLDVDGFRGPNTIGKDIFWLRILNNGTIKPFGSDDSYPPNTTCIDGSTNAENTGRGCSLKRLID